MTNHEQELISVLLGDSTASPSLDAWLRTDAGRRTRAAYRDTLRTLRSAFGTRALERERTAVCYAAIDSPVGRVFVAATPAGVARIVFGGRDDTFVADLRRRLHAEVIHSTERIGKILEQIDAYFAGKRPTFELPVDAQLMTAFQRRVLAAAQRVPAGTVVSYGNIARAIGQPTASRAVGQALGHNPIPVVIPCHRVIASNGSLGGYIGGLAIKKKLLALEGQSRGDVLPAKVGDDGRG